MRVILFVLVLVLVCTSSSSSSSSDTIIGVNYTPSQSTSSSVLSGLSRLGLKSILIHSPNPTSIHSFIFSNTCLHLTLPNSLIPSLASNTSSASHCLLSLVFPFFPRSNISSISVGDSSFLHSSPHLSSFILPAIHNLRLSLISLGLNSISVSTTFSFLSLLSPSFFPPSSAVFSPPISRHLINPLLAFLRQTNSSFFVSIYPYYLYRTHLDIPIGFALFEEDPFNFRDDVNGGVRYRNLFDAMVDAVVCAMEAEGYGDIPLVVAETGWPTSSSDPAELDANVVYAEMYVKGLVRHLRSGLGTPMRKEGLAGVYIHELFDTFENGSQSWGILYPNLTAKYDVDFSRGFRGLGMEGVTFLYLFFGFLVLV